MWVWVFCIQGAVEARSTAGFYSSPDTDPVIMIRLCCLALVLYGGDKSRHVCNKRREQGVVGPIFVTVDKKRSLLYSEKRHSFSSSSSSLFHALLVMPGHRRRCKRVGPHFSTAAPAARLEHVITVFISLLLRFLSSCVCVVTPPPLLPTPSLPPPAHPAETANRAPALYRQSNPRPTSSRPTSTSCRSSWHVSPNVPASSSPPSTVYRSVLQHLTFKQLY